MDWQPIETVPKGWPYGRWVLLSWGGIPQVGLVRKDGSVAGTRGEDISPFGHPPTHWMELPKPPPEQGIVLENCTFSHD